MIIHTGCTPFIIVSRCGLALAQPTCQNKSSKRSSTVPGSCGAFSDVGPFCISGFEDRRMYYRSEDLNDKLFIHYKASVPHPFSSKLG